MGAHYHPSLTDGTFDRKPANQSRPDMQELRQQVAQAEQTDAPDAGDVLLELDRSKKGEAPEKLRIAIKEYESHKYLDCRIWWRRQDGTWLPTKRGITVRGRELSDVMRVLAEAGKKLGANQ